jgi:TPR repeat protein
MTRAHGLTDDHEGHHIPFWQEACAADRVKGCVNLASMYRRYCTNGSPWACNELGVLGTTGKATLRENPTELFQQSCAMRIVAGCENATALEARRTAVKHGDPTYDDYLVVLKDELLNSTPDRLAVFTLACDQGYVSGCGNIGDVYMQGQQVPKDLLKARTTWEQSCARGHADSCTNLGVMYHLADSVAKDDVKASDYLKRSCDLGQTRACGLFAELNGAQLQK